MIVRYENVFYQFCPFPQILNITKQYTGITNKTEAVIAFKKELNSSRMWHNHGPFPSNESNENAFKKCISPETAKKYCPVRWAAIQRWAAYCREVIQLSMNQLPNLHPNHPITYQSTTLRSIFSSNSNPSSMCLCTAVN